MARKESGTVRPAKRRRVFLAAAVVLLVCVLAAGAVSADTVTVSNYEQLSSNISSNQDDLTIIIAKDIQVGVNQGFTVTKNITLTTTDNANHRIYRTAENESTATGMFTILENGNLTIQGNSSQKLILDGNKTANTANNQTLIWIQDGGEFTLNYGGVLTNNTAIFGGAVFMKGASSTFTMSGGEISSNNATQRGSGSYTGDGGGVHIDNGTFTMNGGTITRNWANNSGGGVYVHMGIGTVFTMSSGEITDNIAEKNGGGVLVNDDGKFTMENGKISNNTAGNNGGGVYLLGSTFTMSGGEISGNTAKSGNGGGVDVRTDSTFTMSDGTITGNAANGTGYGADLGNGGGVCTDTDTLGTFTMSGGTIIGNWADTNGTGVYVGGTFNVTTGGTADSVYLPAGKIINVINEFAGKISGIVSEDRDIGTRIVSFNPPVQGSPEDRTYFQLDKTEMSPLGLKYNAEEDVLELAPTYTVSFQAYEGTPEPEDQTVTHGDPVDEPTTLTKDDHTFAGWHDDASFITLWDFAAPVTKDLILHAKWIPNKPEPEPPSGGGSSDGNMDNAYRVLFNDGATTLYIVTDLSAGDKLTKPEDPVKDGYTFAGWHKDTACTQPWDFNDGITGSMTLYAKWTPQETVTPTATATVTPTATATATATPTGNASPAPTVQPDNNGNNGDTTNGETTKTSGISLPYLIGGILILLLAILLLLILLLRHTVTFLIPTGGELEEYRIKVWHGRYINTEDLPDLIRTAAWYRDPARQERWDFDQDRVKKSIELYLG